MTFASPKGQGATEYLVLLAVVLIVAMVAIALLGFFPGLSYDAKKSESDSYWRSARPFQVQQHTMPANGNLTMVVGNVDSNQLKLTNIAVGGSGYAGNYNTTTYVASGQSTTLTINWTTMGSCASGTVYEFNVNFSYDGTGDNPIVNQKQYGAKTILGKCA